MTAKTKIDEALAQSKAPLENAVQAITKQVQDNNEFGKEFIGAFGAGGKAYVSGLVELNKTLFGYGKEIFDGAVEHSKKTLAAKNMREVMELQAAYAQTRVETSTAHVKEFADLARVKAQAALAPIVDAVKSAKAA